LHTGSPRIGDPGTDIPEAEVYRIPFVARAVAAIAVAARLPENPAIFESAAAA
jgi:hypothetical protein